VSISSIDTPTISGTRLLKTADGTVDYIDNTIYGIDFTIGSLTAGASYQLQSRKFGSPNQGDSTDVANVGIWESVDSKTATGADMLNKELHFYHTPPNQRQGYEYRVIGSANGKDSDIGYLTADITSNFPLPSSGTAILTGETNYVK
jgi:hypothetical protein